ncbi:cell division protein DrpB, partial [Escherichia coli]
STAGKWLGALVGFLFMALVGALLGSIAWYTRPRPARSRRYE